MYKNNGPSNIHHHCNPTEDMCDIKNTCSFEGVRPATLNKPYPEIKVMAKNKYYADILSEDFAGMVSELSAITQYVNHEIRISPVYCKAARTLLSIAQAEMDHLQRLGLLIMLLGGESCGELKFNTCCNSHDKPWTPDYIDYQRDIRDMIIADINGEHKAIEQYKKHIREIDDPCVQANLQRIIEDEMYHIRLLTELLHEMDNNPCHDMNHHHMNNPHTNHHNMNNPHMNHHNMNNPHMNHHHCENDLNQCDNHMHNSHCNHNSNKCDNHMHNLHCDHNLNQYDNHMNNSHCECNSDQCDNHMNDSHCECNSNQCDNNMNDSHSFNQYNKQNHNYNDWRFKGHWNFKR